MAQRTWVRTQNEWRKSYGLRENLSPPSVTPDQPLILSPAFLRVHRRVCHLYPKWMLRCLRWPEAVFLASPMPNRLDSNRFISVSSEYYSALTRRAPFVDEPVIVLTQIWDFLSWQFIAHQSSQYFVPSLFPVSATYFAWKCMQLIV